MEELIEVLVGNLTILLATMNALIPLILTIL